METPICVFYHERKVVCFWCGSCKDLEEGQLLSDVVVFEGLAVELQEALDTL